MSKQPIQASQGAEDAPEASKQEQYGTFRLDALGVSGNGSMIEGPPKRRVPFQAVVLVALVVLSAGALYAMRRLGMGPLGAIAEVKIDYDYEKSRGSGADHRKLLADLSTSQVERQVPADKVQKNPFRMPELHPEITHEVKTEEPKEDPTFTARKKREEEILAEYKSLKVHTVLSGAVPVARIGDDNVRVGDRVGQFFTVQAIGGRTVDLIVDGRIFTLSLDDEVAGGKRKSTPRK